MDELDRLRADNIRLKAQLQITQSMILGLTPLLEATFAALSQHSDPFVQALVRNAQQGIDDIAAAADAAWQKTEARE